MDRPDYLFEALRMSKATEDADRERLLIVSLSPRLRYSKLLEWIGMDLLRSRFPELDQTPESLERAMCTSARFNAEVTAWAHYVDLWIDTALRAR